MLRKVLILFFSVVLISCEDENSPVGTVTRFIDCLGTGDYPKAYALTHNPSWGLSTETFGAEDAFGGISATKIIEVKLESSDEVTALVHCKYYAEDGINGSGLFTENFHLSLEDYQWKITKIDVLQKEKTK